MRLVTKLASVVAPIFAAAVVDRLMRHLPEIVDAIADRVVAGIVNLPAQSIDGVVGLLPDAAERIARTILGQPGRQGP